MRIPSTKELRAFALVAQLGSIKAAAERLCLTSSALSRRIQSLEEELGQSLFIRDARGLSLTEDGKEYADKLHNIFQALEEATSFIQQRSKRRLRIVAPSTIVAAIMPNLDSFEQNCPGVDIELHEQTISSPAEISSPETDLVFSWGESHWEGWNSLLITPNAHISPLCTRQLLNRDRLFSAQELSAHTWIVAKHFEDGWQRWYEALGMPLPEPRRVVTVSNGQTAHEMALHGQGILMGFGFAGMASFPVLFGKLTYAHAFHALVPGFGYYLHTRRHADNPATLSFKQWFFGEVWSLAAVQRHLVNLSDTSNNCAPQLQSP